MEQTLLNDVEAVVSISEDVGTTTEHASVRRYRLREGRYRVALDRLSAWHTGCQTATVSLPDLELHLDSGREKEGFFAIAEEAELVVTLVQQFLWFGNSSGMARITCQQVGTVDRSGRALLPVSLLRWLGENSSPARPVPEIREEVCEASVFVIGKGMLSHWLGFFQFTDGPNCVCDLVARDSEGRLFQRNSWRFRKVDESLEGFLKKSSCRRLHHPLIQVQTSRAELQQKCRLNARNGAPFSLDHDNCQRWLKTLLVDGYSVDPELLPPRWGQVAQELQAVPGLVSELALGTPIAGLMSGAIAGSATTYGTVMLLSGPHTILLMGAAGVIGGAGYVVQLIHSHRERMAWVRRFGEQ